jgi:uncharacterized protein YgiM (DUF1202 family)
MKSNFTIYFLIAASVFHLFNPETTAQISQIKTVLNSIQQQYAPDKRIAVFDISYELGKSGLIVNGEVDNPAAKNAVIVELQKSLKRKVLDSIRVLPDPALGENNIGIVLIDVGNVRRKPNRHAELLTQVLMGTEIKLLKKSNGYYYIQVPDKYLGWINESSVLATNRVGVNAWSTVPKVIVTEFAGAIREKPEISSMLISDVVTGCILKINSRKDGWTSVELANGQRGFIPDASIQDLEEWNKSRMLTSENIEKTAKSLLGVPYIWGGTSVKGMDCSGFVKTVFRLNGMELNRDANQQAEQGSKIISGRNFENLQKGDLLFFRQTMSSTQPEHITHVGIYLEDKMFIHSVGKAHKVSLGSFDSTSQYYEESLLKRLVRVRRIIQQ